MGRRTTGGTDTSRGVTSRGRPRKERGDSGDSLGVTEQKREKKELLIKTSDRGRRSAKNEKTEGAGAGQQFEARNRESATTSKRVRP